MQAYKIVTININRITTGLKVAALRQFVYESEADILLLQEVLLPDLSITGFRTFANIALEDSTGTAILVRDGIPVRDIEKIESGRGIGCKIFDVTVVNLYAPSGSSNKAARSAFFKTEAIYLLRQNPQYLILGGDFNCVLSPKDQSPNFNYCKELHDLVKHIRLKDAWEIKYPTLVRYTFFTSDSSSRLDRVYVTDTASDRVLSTEVIPAVFSDHCALSVTVNLDKQPTKCYRNQWMLNVSLLRDVELADVIQNTWNICLRSINRYPSKLEWWIRMAKRRLRQCLMDYGRQKSREIRLTTDFYYSVLRELYEKSDDTNTHLPRIKSIKAKLISIKRQQLDGLKTKSKARSLIEDETTSLYHLLKHQSNRRRTFIDELLTTDGNILSNQREIVHEIHKHYTTLYSREHVDETSVADFVQILNSDVTHADNSEILADFTDDEVLELIAKSPANKSPGLDGLPKEFYCTFWNIIGPMFTAILNEIMQGGAVPSDFKEGKMVLVPKTRGHKRIDNFRPLTLLNFDYKTVARAINNRLTSPIRQVVLNHQSCFPGRTIMSTISEYRDAIAIASVTDIRCALLFLDFYKAFDHVSYRYVEQVMRRIGLEDRVLTVIRNVVTGITARISVNGQMTNSIRIERGVPQGSPLSMLMFVLSLEPLLRKISEKLSGVTISGATLVVRAYADDVGVLLRCEDEVRILKGELDKYSAASGAKINIGKCKLVNIRGFEDIDIPWAQRAENHKTLGITIDKNPLRMAAKNWRETTNKLHGTMMESTWRSVNLVEKTRIANIFFFSKAYYMAQVFPLPKLQARKIMQLAARYVWKGNIFKLKPATISKPRITGGLALTDITRKASALYIKRITRIMHENPHTITAKLFTVVQPKSMIPPIDIKKLTFQLKHVGAFYLEFSYLGERLQRKTYLTTSDIMQTWQKTDQPNPIVLKQPSINWQIVWKNLSLPIHSSEVVSTWYKVVNQLIATNEKLYHIGLSNTDKCLQCGLVDTVLHRFTCGGHVDSWRWVRKRLALLTRSSETSYTTEILLWPDTAFYPATKNNTVMWMLGNYVAYSVNKTEGNSLLNFEVYMETERWKAIRFRNVKKYFGNMFDILFEKHGIG